MMLMGILLVLIRITSLFLMWGRLRFCLRVASLIQIYQRAICLVKRMFIKISIKLRKLNWRVENREYVRI